MKVKIDIDTHTFIRFWLVAIGFVLAFGAIYLSRSALVSIGIAIFLAIALNPPVSWISKRLPGKSRIGATAIAFVLVVSALGLLIFLIVPPVVEQTSKFAQTVPSLVDKAVSQRANFEDFINQYGLSGALDQVIANTKAQASEASQQLGGALVGIGTTMVSSVFNVVFVLVLSFFMLVEGPVWARKVWDLYEDVDTLESHRLTVTKMYNVVTGFVTGQLLIALVGAICAFIALLIMSAISGLGVPPNLALPIAVMIFLFALVPMVGTTIGGALAGLILLLNSPLSALIFVIYFVVYQQIENNVIAPQIQSKSVELSVLWTLVAILIGTTLFGLIGGLISIPIAGCLRVLLIDYLARAKKLREIDAKKGPVAKLLKKVTSS